MKTLRVLNFHVFSLKSATLSVPPKGCLEEDIALSPFEQL